MAISKVNGFIPIQHEGRENKSRHDSQISTEWTRCLKEISPNHHQIAPKIVAKLAQAVDRCFHADGDIHYLTPDISPRQALVDKINRRVFIFTEEKGRFMTEGKDKMPSPVIALLFEGSCPYTAIPLVSLSPKEGQQIAEREMAIEKLFGLEHEEVHFPGSDGELHTKLLVEAYDGDLFNCLGDLSFEECFYVFSDIVAHVKQMHETGFVHGDIKTKNVLFRRNVDGSVQARLTDWGSAYDFTGTYPKSKDLDLFYGTVWYTAPERFRMVGLSEDPEAQGKAEDMYALGCLLYELLYSCTFNREHMYMWHHYGKDLPAPYDDTPVHLAVSQLIPQLFTDKPEERLTIQELASVVTSLEI